MANLYCALSRVGLLVVHVELEDPQEITGGGHVISGIGGDPGQRPRHGDIGGPRLLA